MFKKNRKSGFNPMIRIALLMNQYHSIDFMEGTKEEKRWAKSRLEKTIMDFSKGLSTILISQLKISMKSKAAWEGIKEQYLG
jgi:hypothetical protein